MSAPQNGPEQQPQDAKDGQDGQGAKPAEDANKSIEDQLADLTAKFETLQTNSRKWETRAKENKDAAKELADLKAQGMDPGQKLQSAEDRATKAERELARYKVAAEVGVPADLLAGDDEDAMREHATRLKTYAGDKAKTTPKPDPSQGGSGGPGKTSAADEGRAEAQRRFGKKN